MSSKRAGVRLEPRQAFTIVLTGRTRSARGPAEDDWESALGKPPAELASLLHGSAILGHFTPL